MSKVNRKSERHSQLLALERDLEGHTPRIRLAAVHDTLKALLAIRVGAHGKTECAPENWLIGRRLEIHARRSTNNGKPVSAGAKLATVGTGTGPTQWNSAMLYTRRVIGEETLSSTSAFNLCHSAIFSTAIKSFILRPVVGPYRNVWSAAELQAKNRERQVGLR